MYVGTTAENVTRAAIRVIYPPNISCEIWLMTWARRASSTLFIHRPNSFPPNKSSSVKWLARTRVEWRQCVASTSFTAPILYNPLFLECLPNFSLQQRAFALRMFQNVSRLSVDLVTERNEVTLFFWSSDRLSSVCICLAIPRLRPNALDDCQDSLHEYS